MHRSLALTLHRIRDTLGSTQNPRIIAPTFVTHRGIREASMAHEAHESHHEQNVCLTGTVVMAAFAGGLTISAIIFIWTFAMH
jgi:hypothetical protein